MKLGTHHLLAKTSDELDFGRVLFPVVDTRGPSVQIYVTAVTQEGLHRSRPNLVQMITLQRPHTSLT
jgi:hypothetical protein